MLKNYLLVALRNGLRHALHTWISVLSLALGIASCLVVYLFIEEETTFDSFHSRASDIYRVNELQRLSSGDFQKLPLTGSPFGPALQSEFPEIESFVRVHSLGKKVFNTNDRQALTGKDVLWVDSTFLEIFDFELLHGDRITALNQPRSVVLTASLAAKLYENVADAIGQMVLVGDNQDPSAVTGVIQDPPEHSHLQFEALVPMAGYLRDHPEFNTDWVGNGLFTYLLLQPEAEYKALEEKFPEWLLRWTEVSDINKWFGIYLQPLSEIHLGSSDIVHDNANYRKFNGEHLSAFAIVGAIVLLIACVNFANLTTARAAHRWKEIAVRKSLGAAKIQLFSQFISESILVGLAALTLALAIDLIFVPQLNGLTGRHIDASLLFRAGHLGLLVALTAMVAFFSALYPSLQMTGKLVDAFKGRTGNHRKSVTQSTLVIVQFGLAMMLIVSTLVVLDQLTFMRSQDLGFNKEQIVIVPLNKQANTKLPLLKTELEGLTYTIGVTASSQRIGNTLHQQSFTVRTDTGLYKGFYAYLNVDHDYLDVYEIRLSSGRTFSNEFINKREFIVNESMAREIGHDPVGLSAGYESEVEGIVVGVVDDFKFNSLHHKVSSLSIVCDPTLGYDEMSIRVNGAHMAEALAGISEVWERVIDSHPFVYSFLDDHFEQLYHDDEQFGGIVAIVAGLAIFIACMGLFALAAIVTQRRTKEIAIRKTMGASVRQVAWMVSMGFSPLILVSLLVGGPIAFWALSQWLENFAYRVEMSPLLFVSGGVLVLMLAWVTVSYHTVKIARTNPADSLRGE